MDGKGTKLIRYTGDSMCIIDSLRAAKQANLC